MTLAARIAACCLVAVTGHAYTAETRAGAGSARISGYAIDDIRYELESDSSSQLPRSPFGSNRRMQPRSPCGWARPARRSTGVPRPRVVSAAGLLLWTSARSAS